MKGNYLSTLLRSERTVFSTHDIAMLWQQANTDASSVRLNYFVNKGDLYRIRKGLYAKSRNYNPMELATRILTPSYISFETLLVREGLIFQYYEPIFLASYTTRDLVIDGRSYIFRKLKDVILLNEMGVNHIDFMSIASAERAFLDTLYLNQNTYFDNLSPLNWDKVMEILPVYHNKALSKKVQALYKSREPDDH